MLVLYHYDNGTRSCANRVTRTATDTKLTNYLGSAQTKFTWHNGRYARAQIDRGGADACAFGRDGAESATFDLEIDDRQRIPNRVIHISYNAKNAQQRVSG